MFIKGNKWAVKFLKILNPGQWCFSAKIRSRGGIFPEHFKMGKYLSSICAFQHLDILTNHMRITHFFNKNTWLQSQPAVSYFSVYFQPKVFLIMILIFVFEFPESRHSICSTNSLTKKIA